MAGSPDRASSTVHAVPSFEPSTTKLVGIRAGKVTSLISAYAPYTLGVWVCSCSHSPAYVLPLPSIVDVLPTYTPEAYDEDTLHVHRLATLAVPTAAANACHGYSLPNAYIDDAVAVTLSPAIVMGEADMPGDGTNAGVGAVGPT